MQPAIPISRPLVTDAAQSAPQSVAVSKASDRWGFLEIFILAQVILPALLYLPGSQAFRVPIRIAPFAISLLGLAFLLNPKRAVRPHPCRAMLMICMAYLVLMIGSPGTNTTLAGFAQVMLYFSVMAPVFWAPLLVRSKRQLQRIMAILLICNGVNAIVGVLQVKYPDRFMPKELTSVYTEMGDDAIGKYVGANGEIVIRPPGLSDNPGAVCGPASVAALLGLVMAIRPIAFWQRGIAAAMAFAGVAAIYLSHVRTSLLILGGMCGVYCILLIAQKQQRRALTFAALAAGLFVVGLFAASLLGGEAITERFSSLLQEDPTTLYQRNRGYMLRDTATYIADYPLGAGLGRWGMMRLYFGDEGNANSPQMWAEIQFPAWALDGGIVLIVLYLAVLLRNMWTEWRTCFRLRGTSVGGDMAVIVASNAGVLALLFSFTPFTTQGGLQYWFLAGVLFGVSQLPRQELV
jgi:hypothetical protein